MKRRLLNLGLVVSLLMFVACVALSAFRVDGTYLLRDGGGFSGGSDVATWVVFADDGRAGIGWTHSDMWFEGEIAAPLWLLAMFTAAGPVSWLLRTAWRPPTKSAGICRTCGYDLTGNVSGVCPECGGAFGGGLADDLHLPFDGGA